MSAENDVDHAVKLATEQVQEQLRSIQLHYDPPGDRLGGPHSTGLGLGRPGRKWQEAINSATEEAKAIVLRPSILERLCPALRSITEPHPVTTVDTFEISRVMVGVLVPLNIAGTIAIPWNPLVIAAAAVLIARVGVATICKDVKGDKGQRG